MGGRIPHVDKVRHERADVIEERGKYVRVAGNLPVRQPQAVPA